MCARYELSNYIVTIRKAAPNKPAPPPGGGPKPTPEVPAPPSWQQFVLPIGAGILVLVVMILFQGNSGGGATSLSYTDFLAKAEARQVQSVDISSSGDATGKLRGGESYKTVIPVTLAGPNLVDTLRANDVTITATGKSSSSPLSTIVSWLLLLGPFALIGWLVFRISKGGLGSAAGARGVGKSRARVFDAERSTTTFADIAGYEGVKSEIGEIVSFLREPDRYRSAGAVAPRGLLMLGPPGTGKTLFARAVAGEAGVPFFYVAGSSFVEMFVGVGAARVRDLFEEARKSAPSIIFVDEIDAIGQRRSGSGAAVSNDEREQTLNQLLSEMDGFDPTVGVVVLAATNRPEVLDLALLRPGRFDRQVTIPLPTQAERRAILAVHCKDKRLADVDLDVIARATPGFSGADLANLANETAIAAVRDNRDTLTADDFWAARDRIVLGRRDGSNALLPEEKHAVAIHESGHALVAALLPRADPVAKITILPAGQTLGVTEQLPLVERRLYSETYLQTALAVRLGGRAAELIEFGEGSTGAANDLVQATELATKMVREFGLSVELGPVGYPVGGSVFLGGDGNAFSSRPFAEATQARIDAEVSRLVREAESRALQLLREHYAELHILAERLSDRETIDGAEVYALVKSGDLDECHPAKKLSAPTPAHVSAATESPQAPYPALVDATARTTPPAGEGFWPSKSALARRDTGQDPSYGGSS